MRKKHVGFVLLVLAVLILLVCFILGKTEKDKNEISSLTAKIVPLEFTLKTDGEYLEIEYSFLDLLGEVLKTETARLRGNELFVDCIVKDFDSETKVAFPIVFYSNIVASSEGIIIVNEYNDKGFPEIFMGVKAFEKKKLKKLYEKVLLEVKNENTFRSSPHILASKKKEVYRLTMHTRGGLEIIKIEDKN